MARCDLHCPGAGDAVATAVAVAAVAAGVAVVVFAVEYAVILVPGLAGVGVVTFALQRFLLRHTVLRWDGRYSPLMRRRAPARVAVEAATARRAIEAPKPVVYRITDLGEIRERR